MFSKALFKQSCKANGIMWAIITFAVCFMLACVMMIAGSGDIGNIRTGITNTIVEGAMDAQIQNRSVNYYMLVNNGLATFDAKYENNPANINIALSAVNDYVNAQGLDPESQDYLELKGLVFGCFNLPDDAGVRQFDQFYADCADYTTPYLSKPASQTRDEYARNYASAFLAYNMVDPNNVDKLVAQLEKYTIDLESFKNLTYTNASGEEVSRYTGTDGFVFMNDMSRETIVTFTAKLQYELGQLDPTDPDYATKSALVTKDLMANTGKSFLSSLPAEVSQSLEELGSMDLYGMITGSIFFKMAGLLLPIIYIIMVSNNLIAGQVDSGSMAYILSTSTKRKQVVFTQAVFLVSSLFVMFSLTTATSCVCLALVNNSAITMTYGEIILLNLGAFITLFAMSGISFLASCWFNRSKHSMSLGGGLNMFFLVATMLGLFGSNVLPTVVRMKSLNFFNYCSIISLFDEISILNHTTAFIWKWAILLGIGIICYIVGAIKFKKKDLPL